MTKVYPGEKWKEIKFDFEFTNKCRLEVSNFGRIRTFNALSDGNVLKGSMINGYRIIRLKFYSHRQKKIESKFQFIQQQISKLTKKISPLKQSIKIRKNKDEHYFSNLKTVEETSRLLTALKKNLSEQYKQDLKERTIHYHALVHRLVAQYFCLQPSPEHTVVGHVDHNKLNNAAGNLVWMTPQENFVHQQSSPSVIAAKSNRSHTRIEHSKATKLTVIKVMLLKKLLNQGRPMRMLVKQFRITDTQILRIKRGENWADVQAAK